MLNIGKVVVGQSNNIKTVEVIQPTQTSISSGLSNKNVVVPVSEGGTGSTTFANNGILIGNGANSIVTLSSNTEGNILTIDANGAPRLSMISCGTF